MKPSDSEGVNAKAFADIDRLVHEPARLTILVVLHAVECADFLFLLRQTGLTRGNLSSHMSKLEDAGYIEVSKEFVDKIPRTLLRLTSQGKKAIQTYQTTMARMLAQLSDTSP